MDFVVRFKALAKSETLYPVVFFFFILTSPLQKVSVYKQKTSCDRTSIDQAMLGEPKPGGGSSTIARERIPCILKSSLKNQRSHFLEIDHNNRQPVRFQVAAFRFFPLTADIYFSSANTLLCGLNPSSSQ